MVIGEHIEGYVAGKGAGADKWELRLWQYVSRYTENSMDGAKLRSVYTKIKGALSEVLIPPPSENLCRLLKAPSISAVRTVFHIHLAPEPAAPLPCTPSTLAKGL